MKTISVGELRQNPTAALDAVEHGETFVVTRHRREIARLVPPAGSTGATPEQYARMLRSAPLDGSWAAEVARDRKDFDDRPDPWTR